MATTSIDIGDVVRVTGIFRVQNVQTDPTTVVGKTKKPSGAILELSITRVSQGVYTFDIPITQAGEWAIRMEGTGDAPAASEAKFRVRESEF